MSYSEPRQLQNEKWHFTTNDGVIRPIGYCADGCKGHDTPEEAREHYRDYILDKARFGVEMRQTLKCRECGEDTYLAVITLPRTIVSLCGDHHTRECLRPLVGGDSLAT